METLLMVGIVIAVICILLFIIFMITGTSQKGIERTLTKMRNSCSKSTK